MTDGQLKALGCSSRPRPPEALRVVLRSLLLRERCGRARSRPGGAPGRAARGRTRRAAVNGEQYQRQAGPEYGASTARRAPPSTLRSHPRAALWPAPGAWPAVPSPQASAPRRDLRWPAEARRARARAGWREGALLFPGAGVRALRDRCGEIRRVSAFRLDSQQRMASSAASRGPISSSHGR